MSFVIHKTETSLSQEAAAALLPVLNTNPVSTNDLRRDVRAAAVRFAAEFNQELSGFAMTLTRPKAGMTWSIWMKLTSDGLDCPFTIVFRKEVTS